MTGSIVNFNAGPAGLPRAALERARDEFLDFDGTGISVMEHSHRGKAYDAVHTEALRRVRELMNVPDSHDVLFMQGGASQIFAVLPMNFIGDGSADYVVTGAWSEKALSEAKLVGRAREAGTGAVDGRFVRIPTVDELQLDAAARYVHITSNNTIAGTQYHSFFDTGDVPLCADMSSDIMWRPIDVSKFKLIYAGAQKNIGPSGVAVVIVDKAFADTGSKSIPEYFRFKTHLDKGSLYNTPPTFSVYMVRNVLAHLAETGGVEAAYARNREKGDALYAAIDNSGGFYSSLVEKDSRSYMNVVFTLPTEPLNAAFISAAQTEGMIGLKGHRSVGGCRASIYNAVSVEGATKLAEFMNDFAKKNG